jgi:tRNA A-37 threonylcarbamoyl transferase component Bud32
MVISRQEMLRRLDENDRDLQRRRRIRENEIIQKANEICSRISSIIQHREEDCTICLEKINNNYHKTSCNHYFHNNCINSWKNTGQNSCPNCREKL